MQAGVILSVDGLRVMRGERTLCSGVRFCVQAGEICHLQGENGLGKTTLLMQVVGILPTVEGRIDFLGQPFARGALYVAHQTGLHESLSVGQNLRFLVALYGLDPQESQLAWALEQVGLAGFETVAVAQLSAGQTRRVGLARLWLLHKIHTCLWVLDEPLTALDKAMVERLCQRLLEFAATGGAVLLTSHQPLTVCQRVVDLGGFVEMDDE